MKNQPKLVKKTIDKTQKALKNLKQGQKIGMVTSSILMVILSVLVLG